MSPSVLGDSSAGLSQGSFDEDRASQTHRLASDVMEGNRGEGGSPPPSSRSPGMHLGHELLLAMTVALALFATLVLNATHC